MSESGPLSFEGASLPFSTINPTNITLCEALVLHQMMQSEPRASSLCNYSQRPAYVTPFRHINTSSGAST